MAKITVKSAAEPETEPRILDSQYFPKKLNTAQTGLEVNTREVKLRNKWYMSGTKRELGI